MNEIELNFEDWFHLNENELTTEFAETEEMVMKVHIRSKSGFSTVCKTKNRVVALSEAEFLNELKERQCVKCFLKVQKKQL